MTEALITVVDYGAGNTGSVCNALRALGATPSLVHNGRELEAATHIILPGVGSFGDAMGELESRGLADALVKAIGKGIPFLGICLGMHILFEGSEESPGVKGLGLLSGRVKRLEPGKGIKVPHMGWNQLRMENPCALFTGLPVNPWVYFVHSYYIQPGDKSVVTAAADYPGAVAMAVARDNVQAVQFHPEKSGSVGLAMLGNWLGGGAKCWRNV